MRVQAVCVFTHRGRVVATDVLLGLGRPSAGPLGPTHGFVVDGQSSRIVGADSMLWSAWMCGCMLCGGSRPKLGGGVGGRVWVWVNCVPEFEHCGATMSPPVWHSVRPRVPPTSEFPAHTAIFTTRYMLTENSFLLPSMLSSTKVVAGYTFWQPVAGTR